MKIEGISSLITVPVSNIVRAQVSEGAIVLPVNTSGLVYSNFKNVKGIPAPNGTGYTINRLRALDSLIERLRGLGVDEAKLSPALNAGKGGNTENLETIVRSLQQELSETLNKRAVQFRGSAGLDAGLAVNFLL